jgi:serine protease Do
MSSILRAACVLLVASLGTTAAVAAPAPSPSPPPGGRQQEMTVDVLSVVRLRSRAVADARSASTLGREREGTGVVIDASGLVLTIGYLILEAETVELSTADGRSFPATVVGYDAVTGFGLVRALGGLPIKPIKVGESSRLATREPVFIVGFDGVAPGYVVSRRRFVGYWEYMLDDAIYTAPATVNWQGAV